MTYTTDKSNRKTHGGYRNLLSYQTSTLIYDLTVKFCETYVDYRSRTRDQMTQAARSGRQNIAERSQVSATSKKSEIKLVGVARASLEELLIDYEDYLRQKGLKLWIKEDPRSQKIRKLGYTSNRSYMTYKAYTSDPESYCNCLISLIHQANFLLDRQLQSLEKSFLEDGGYTENLFKKRQEFRKRNY